MQKISQYQHLSYRFLQSLLDRSVPYLKVRWLILSSLTSHVIYRIWMYDYLAIMFFWGLYILYLLVQYFTPSGLPDPDQDDGFLQSEKKNANLLEDDIEFEEIEGSVFSSHSGSKHEEIQSDETLMLGSEEARPLLRTITEFTLWKNIMLTLCVSWLCTLSDVFLIPVYWPFLLIYFIWLIGLAIHKHIKHMRKYQYRPSDFSQSKHIFLGNKTLF